MAGIVTFVSRSARHRFSKENELIIRLIEGIGVEGDGHAGKAVQHRYSRRKNVDQANLRQVHLMQEELFDSLAREGFFIRAGALGENITTRGIDLVSLPECSRLHIGRQVIVEVTGLRTPCRQMDKFAAGLTKAVMVAPAPGEKPRSRAGVMAIVVSGGEVGPGDVIEAHLPAGPSKKLRHI